MRAVALIQRHGGPDSLTVVNGGGWALANNRLAIMDPGGGDQPFRLGDEIIVVFNGEIYNHHELRRWLRQRGHHLTGTCDGNILPALYAEHGPDFAEYLDGMFAVAVVDLRDDPVLVLATDHAGMKPLYYHRDARNGRMHFSSELPALLSFRAVPVRPRPLGLDTYLSTKTPFGEQTMFEEIMVMPPGAVMTVSRRDGMALRRRSKPAAVPCPGDSLEKSGERVHEVLRREVDRLAVADVPVCAITSGGLDSSFVTALLAETMPELHMFNIAYRGEWPHDERAYACEVAKMWNGRYHQVEIDPRTFPDLLPDVVWHLGQPNADPITLSTFALFEAVHRAGFKVALTGDGADEVFGGYDRIKTALAAGADWADGYRDALAAIPRRLRQRLYTPQYRQLVATGAQQDPSAEILAERRRPRMAAICDVELGRRLPAYHLRRVDHLSMAHAVEVRLPFCQRSVIETGLALPVSHRVAGDQVKRALYRAARKHVPASVLTRPKQPFTLPITAMLRDGEPLMAMVRDLLAPARLRRRGYLEPAAVSRLIEAQRERPEDRSALALWSLAVHELWLEQFAAPAPAQPVEEHA